MISVAGFCSSIPTALSSFLSPLSAPIAWCFQQVTIGVGGTKPGAPVVGGNVYIGAGAKILGGVHIGDHARIGANAVVLQDVPRGATAVGVPARIVDHEQLVNDSEKVTRIADLEGATS